MNEEISTSKLKHLMAFLLDGNITLAQFAAFLIINMIIEILGIFSNGIFYLAPIYETDDRNKHNCDVTFYLI
jgi:hypothetical protein